ncbi:MAG: RHS domain-containing protein, partial [Moraxellaceae bacterium]
MNGLTTCFVYHTSGQLLAETDASNTTTREYLWLEDWPVAMVSMSGDTARLDFIHADHLGTPRRLTDSQQAVIWRWDSAPFGDSPAD